MSENKARLDLKGRLSKLTVYVPKLQKYSFIAFVSLVAVIYGFVLFQINTLKGAEPSQEAVTKQVKAAQIPHVDDEVVKQLESLQDNSVSVQALFDEARSNPFQ